MAAYARRASQVIENFNHNFDASSAPVQEPTSGVCEKFRDRLRDIETRINNAAAQSGLSRRVYPKTEVFKLLTSDNIAHLLECKCKRCRCDSRLEVPSSETMATIFAEYRLILAILLLMNHIYLIQTFIERGYSDERVLNLPLSEGELDELVNIASEKIGVTHWHDKRFAKDFHNERQYEFLLPNLTTATGDGRILFPIIFTLPLDVGGIIGSGACGEVFKAKLLDGYHDFETHDGHVAVKIYKESSSSGIISDTGECYYEDPDEQSWAKEVENHHQFSHPNIVPILTTFGHGNYNMTIYPLAQTSLGVLINPKTKKNDINELSETCPVSLKEIVTNMANLFSALASMHAGVPDFCGYHFDIKPANILVRHDGSWALADLGMAHFKPVVPTDPTFSATGRRPCSEEYGGPEGNTVHRSFDVWSLGCVFAELLVWHAEGQKGVRRFRDSRRKKTGMKVTHEFHDDGKVKEAVLLKLESLSSNNSDPILPGSIRIIRLLLEPEQSKRPSSREVEILLRALLGNGVEMPSPVKPHVKALLEELESANKSKRRS